MIAMEQKPQEKKRRDPQVFAMDCPICRSDNTRVYRTRVIVRYCLCRNCRATWVQVPKR